MNTRAWPLLTLALLAPAILHAEVRLPTIFGNHMVIQRERPIRIWGWADAGEKVEVNFSGKTMSTVASAAGKWHVTFPKLAADSKPRKLVVNDKTLEGILIGDVWVGSGQSNMEWRLRSTKDATAAIEAANHPNIRLYHVPKVKSNKPNDDIKASWKTCTKENIPNFSAVLYYFGRQLHQETSVPMGLINTSWGGSAIEPWTVTEKSSGRNYNAMVAPLRQLAVRGTIWYQGETNCIQKNGFKYRDKMSDLITGWREFWGKEMPFYFVHIAPWSGKRYEPGQLPALWEAQTATLKMPNTGMAVITDLVDNVNDIHPRNKLDVGKRLALWALAKSYGKDVVYSGPLYQNLKVDGDSIRLSFAHNKGLKSRDGKPLSEFRIAGADGKFVAATAKVAGDEVIVSAAGVKNPTQVEFGWHKLANPNLVNAAGLPAAPFRTKDWRGGTGK